MIERQHIDRMIAKAVDKHQEWENSIFIPPKPIDYQITEDEISSWIKRLILDLGNLQKSLNDYEELTEMERADLRDIYSEIDAEITRLIGIIHQIGFDNSQVLLKKLRHARHKLARLSIPQNENNPSNQNLVS